MALRNMPKLSKRPPMPEIMMLTPPKKYIGTIIKDDFYVNEFDEEVNDLIDEGYNLTKREHYFIENGENGKMILYAELEKVVVEIEN